MNEVKLLNIGGIDQNVKDQYARDIIAPSENGLDSTSNLPVASRPYRTGEYLIGQDRLYYEAIDDIEIGDTLVVNVNIKATTVSDELVSLRNKSADAAIECIAPMEKTGLSAAEYKVGEYLYWDYGLNAGLYKAKTGINIGDAFVIDTNIEAAPNIETQIQTLTNQVDDISDEIVTMNSVLGAKNLLPNNATRQVINGVTFEINPNGSITANGTAGTDNTILVIFQSAYYHVETILSGGKSATKFLRAKNLTTGVDYDDTGNGVILPLTNDAYRIYLCILEGENVNETFYPMIRPSSIKDDTFVPYAMTNLAISNSLRIGDLSQFRAGREESLNADFIDFERKDKSFNRIAFFESNNDMVIQHFDANGNLVSQYDDIGTTGTALTVPGSPFPNVGYARAGRVVSVATYFDITTNWTGWSGVALTGFPKPLIDDYNLSYALYNGALHAMVYRITTDGNLYIYSELPAGTTVRMILKATYITNDQ